MSTKTKQYRIHGIVKLTSPLHIASARKKRIDPDTGFETFGQQGMPCTPMQTLSLPVMRSMKIVKEGDEGSSFKKQITVPVIPANNINGHLRRHGAALIFDALKARDQKVSIEVYSAMTCGAVTGSPDAEMIKFDEYRESRENVFLGLFGGGPRMIRRNVRVHNMVPVTQDTLDVGLHDGASRHPDMDGAASLGLTARIPENVNMITSWTFLRNDDLKSLADVEQQESIIEDYVQKIQEYQAKILEEKAKGKGGDRFSTFTFSAFEFVIPGIMFPMTYELDVTEAQLGLFLLALDRFAEKDRIGGITRNGLGQFALQNMVLLDVATGEKREIFKAGRLNRGEDSPAYPFLVAFQQAAQELSVERLNFLMRPPVESEKVKAKKAAKASKAAGEVA